MVFFPSQLKQAFSQWRVTSASIDDREVQVLQGTNPRQPPVNLYFDQSGLLVRLVRFVDNAVGRVPTQVDQDDYRYVRGTNLTFKSTAHGTDPTSTVEVTQTQT